MLIAPSLQSKAWPGIEQQLRVHALDPERAKLESYAAITLDMVLNAISPSFLLCEMGIIGVTIT